MVDFDHYVALVLKQKQGNPTFDNVGGRGSQIYSWSKFPIDLVPDTCLVADYTARPNVSLQMNTNKEHQILYMSNIMMCVPRMSASCTLWFGLHFQLAHSDSGHKPQNKSEFSLCHHNPYVIHPLQR